MIIYREINQKDNNLKHIQKAYIELLKVRGVTRVDLNSELCGLRDILTKLTNQDMQEVQEMYEEIALQEIIKDKELIKDPNGNIIVL